MKTFNCWHLVWWLVNSTMLCFNFWGFIHHHCCTCHRIAFCWNPGFLSAEYYTGCTRKEKQIPYSPPRELWCLILVSECMYCFTIICSPWWQTLYFWHLVWELVVAPVILIFFWGSRHHVNTFLTVVWMNLPLSCFTSSAALTLS